MNNLEAVPQHDADAERCVLGSMLIDARAAEIAVDELTPDDFYLRKHRILFVIMAQMFLSGEGLDEITVVIEARRRGNLESAGGADAIGGLVVSTPSAASVETHCSTLRRLWEVRELQRLARTVASEQQRMKTCDEIRAAAHAILDGIEWRRAGVAGDPVDLHDVAAPVSHEALTAPGRNLWGLATGVAGDVFDKRTGGIQAGCYVVLAGRASMGKSTFAFTVARGVRRCSPDAGVPLIISNEMLLPSIARAALASEAGIHPTQLLTRHLGSEQRERVKATMSDRKLAGVSVLHLAGGTVEQVAAIAMRHKRAHGLPLLVVDLASRLESQGESEYLQLKSISRGLQKLVHSLGTCIIATVQVSRAAMMNADKRPGLEHLKGCGSWEEDADHVWFLHRPGYYGGKDRRTEFMLAKDRIAGNVGSKWLEYQQATGQYVPSGEE